MRGAAIARRRRPTAADGRVTTRRVAPWRGVPLLLAAACVPAHADQPLWEAGLGLGVLSLPQYRGSSQSRTWLLPVPYAVYRGRILRADRDGARAMLFDGERFDFDLSLAAGPPTRSGDSVARRGMPDLAPTVEIGPKLNLMLGGGADWRLALRLPVRTVLALDGRPRSIGWSAAPVLNLDLALHGWDVGLQAGPIWGDRRLHAYYYGVPPELATPTRPAYTAGGGFAGWQATAGASRRFGRAWVGAFVRSDTVAGAAFERSPLVTQRQTWAGGVAVAWIFAVSDARVRDER